MGDLSRLTAAGGESAAVGGDFTTYYDVAGYPVYGTAGNARWQSVLMYR
ncbi:MAG: hypothetical protein WBC51_08995 [Vicinamibacterales bacterium]|jgi:hypothetical protein